MKNEIGNLKSAVNLFAGTFLKNGVNTITVVEYANEIVNGTPFTTKSADELAKKIKSHNIGSGTNIDAGLTTANGLISETSKNNIKPENTTVIVMTDGEPNWYWDDKGKKHSGSTTLCEAHAKLAAQKIKERGINIYSIGFDLNRSSAKEMMEKISSNYDKENTKKVSNKYYFESSKGEELIKNFTDISSTIISTTDSGIDKLVTNVGIAEIPSTLFEVGQDVEIYYPDMYQTGKSKSKVKYTWNNFINLKYTTYDGKNIKFDLANYMKDNNIVANGEVALRFVISESSTKKTSLSTNKEISSANVLSATINDVKEEKINTNNITEYENKLKESESQKKTENNNKTETTNTNKVVENITNNNTEIKNDTKTKIEENKTTVPLETNKNENTVKTEKENKTESNTNTDTKKAEKTKTNVEKKTTKQTENSKEQQSTKSKTENTLSNEKTENLKTNVEKNAKNNMKNKTDLNKETQNATNNSKTVETKSKTVEETTKQNKENTSNNISTKTQVTSK